MLSNNKRSFITLENDRLLENIDTNTSDNRILEQFLQKGKSKQMVMNEHTLEYFRKENEQMLSRLNNLKQTQTHQKARSTNLACKKGSKKPITECLDHVNTIYQKKVDQDYKLDMLRASRAAELNFSNQDIKKKRSVLSKKISELQGRTGRDGDFDLTKESSRIRERNFKDGREWDFSMPQNELKGSYERLPINDFSNWLVENRFDTYEDVQEMRNSKGEPVQLRSPLKKRVKRDTLDRSCTPKMIKNKTSSKPMRDGYDRFENKTGKVITNKTHKRDHDDSYSSPKCKSQTRRVRDKDKKTVYKNHKEPELLFTQSKTRINEMEETLNGFKETEQNQGPVENIELKVMNERENALKEFEEKERRELEEALAQARELEFYNEQALEANKRTLEQEKRLRAEEKIRLAMEIAKSSNHLEDYFASKARKIAVPQNKADKVPILSVMLAEKTNINVHQLGLIKEEEVKSEKSEVVEAPKKVDIHHRRASKSLKRTNTLRRRQSKVDEKSVGLALMKLNGSNSKDQSLESLVKPIDVSSPPKEPKQTINKKQKRKILTRGQPLSNFTRVGEWPSPGQTYHSTLREDIFEAKRLREEELEKEKELEEAQRQLFKEMGRGRTQESNMDGFDSEGAKQPSHDSHALTIDQGDDSVPLVQKLQERHKKGPQEKTLEEKHKEKQLQKKKEKEKKKLEEEEAKRKEFQEQEGQEENLPEEDEEDKKETQSNKSNNDEERDEVSGSQKEDVPKTTSGKTPSNKQQSEDDKKPNNSQKSQTLVSSHNAPSRIPSLNYDESSAKATQRQEEIQTRPAANTGISGISGLFGDPSLANYQSEPEKTKKSADEEHRSQPNPEGAPSADNKSLKEDKNSAGPDSNPKELSKGSQKSSKVVEKPEKSLYSNQDSADNSKAPSKSQKTSKEEENEEAKDKGSKKSEPAKESDDKNSGKESKNAPENEEAVKSSVKEDSKAPSQNAKSEEAKPGEKKEDKPSQDSSVKKSLPKEEGKEEQSLKEEDQPKLSEEDPKVEIPKREESLEAKSGKSDPKSEPKAVSDSSADQPTTPKTPKRMATQGTLPAIKEEESAKSLPSLPSELLSGKILSVTDNSPHESVNLMKEGPDVKKSKTEKEKAATNGKPAPDKPVQEK